MRAWGTISLHSGFLHTLMSFTVLSSDYLPIFFDGTRMSLRGELSIGFGIYGFWLIRRNISLWARKNTLQILSGIAIAGHVLARGSTGWMNIADWIGEMPPISLISFVLAVASLVLFTVTGRNRKNEPEPQMKR